MSKRIITRTAMLSLLFAYLLVMLQTWPWLVLIFIGITVYRLFKRGYFLHEQANVKHNMLLGVLAFLIAISVAELTLRWRGGNIAWLDDCYTRSERLIWVNYSVMNQYFINENTGWLRILRANPGTIVENCKPEFCHIATVNSEGCNDVEWKIKKTKKYRIACLGDSYTEGVGGTPDSTFERVWQMLDPGIEVMNCGIRSSDPCYEFMLLQERIIKYEPDMVMMSINNSDLSDLIKRGGFERFKSDGSVSREKYPWWYAAYGCSYIVRLFVHNYLKLDYSLMTPEEKKTLTVQAFDNLYQAIDTTAQECSKRNIRFIVNFHPISPEFSNGNKMELLPLMHKAKERGIEVFDMHVYFTSQGISPTNADSLYWPMDGHHNNAGYSMMARGLVTLVK